MGAYAFALNFAVGCAIGVFGAICLRRWLQSRNRRRTYTGPEPAITVWRNKIPHPAVLLYCGRKWEFRSDAENKRLADLRWMHRWAVHAPVDGGETLTLDLTGCPRSRWDNWHSFECYHADGSRMTFTGRADEVRDA